MTNKEAIEILRHIVQVADTSDCGIKEIDGIDEEAIDMAIKALEQEPKTGHWKEYTHSAYHGTNEDGEPIWKPVNVYHCSECNRRTVIKDNFCPNCGARMVEPQERSE